MTWDYRVVRVPGGAEAQYAIYEVFYDEAGQPEARTENPCYPAGETMEELRRDLESYVAALQQPVLDDDVFPQPSVPLEEAERQHMFEAVWQSNVELAEAARMLRATRLEIEAQQRARRQAAGGLFDAAPRVEPDYDQDFYGWTQVQAAAIRAGLWEAVDREHVAEEIEDLWKMDTHSLAKLLVGFLELIYRPCPEELGQYYWQSAVIDYHRSMLRRCRQDRERIWPVLEAQLPEEYAWAREEVLRRKTPLTAAPPARCPWSLAQLLDQRWWPPEAPPRLP